jgi:biopolymer transport protein ExbD
MKLRKRTIYPPKLEIIPMIDIMFFLLVCFMIQSQASSHLQKIHVNLPDSSTSQASQQKAVFVSILVTGSLLLNQQPITLEKLNSGLVTLMRDDPQQTVVIQADKTTSAQTIIHVMDEARHAGVQKFALATL